MPLILPVKVKGATERPRVVKWSQVPIHLPSLFL
jgi:hypothetical protein